MYFTIGMVIIESDFRHKYEIVQIADSSEEILVKHIETGKTDWIKRQFLTEYIQQEKAFIDHQLPDSRLSQID